MALFYFKAVSQSGEVQEGRLEGADQQAIVLQLQQRGLIPLSVEPADGRSAASSGLGLRLGRKRVGERQIQALTQDLAALLKAGVPLERAFGIMIQVRDKGDDIRLLGQIREGIQRGQTLSAVLAEQDAAFSPFYLNMVRAAEVSGNLEQGLSDLALYLERSRLLREKAMSALIYPIILLLVSAVSLLIILTYVIPQFQQLFADMGQAMPLATRVVIGAAEFLRDMGPWLLLLILLGLIYGRRQLAKPDQRLAWDGLLLRLPLAGELIRRLEVARFSRSLGTLMKGGVPLLSALNIARDTVGNQLLANTLMEAAGSLKEGRRLAEPLQASGQFPPLAIQMIRVGEETGQLEDMLLKVADTYDREVENAIHRLLTILEPVLIVGLGVVIAGIIISILVAILGISELPI
ncbi:general secretion pathway protein GspF [Zobellella denitrificans]|uniref:General secretion pathway protein GspF n=1 Tax=Zobellella denitrificans TaxID=347534 RepID=A0A231N0M9_9GAMM|nr:type II secretion system F family protein [Zobellella denitrificans]ATG75698.1 general secretion pathway protein GspF [Zobellella denitrificans]OXS15978.1 general secretion pathway protein GspF [Zobellella denitrificans]